MVGYMTDDRYVSSGPLRSLQGGNTYTYTWNPPSNCSNTPSGTVTCTDSYRTFWAWVYDAHSGSYQNLTHNVDHTTCTYFYPSTSTTTTTTLSNTLTQEPDIPSQVTCSCGPGWIRKRVHRDFHAYNLSGISVARSLKHNTSDNMAYPFMYPSSRTLRMAHNATDDHDPHWPGWYQHPSPTARCAGKSKLCEECIHADDCKAFDTAG